jgi:hypothetical protein
MADYVGSVAADRPSRSRFALLLLALGLLFFAWLTYYSALEPVLDWPSEGWQKVERGRRFARMGWALFFAMMGLWLMARSVRSWLGLPPMTWAGARWFVALRALVTTVLLFILTVRLRETIASPSYEDHRALLGSIAGVVWILFAVDLVPLVRRGIVSLRARVSALAFKRSSVGGPESGRVRIEGTIALGERSLKGAYRPSRCVYRHALDGDGHSVIDLVPFLLESEGHRLFVDLIPERTLVVPEHARITEIGEGDKVEVWGDVTRPSDVFRGQPSRMSPGSGRLYVFQGSRSLNRRLTVAAIFELLASASYLAVGVSFVFFVFDLYLFLI